MLILHDGLCKSLLDVQYYEDKLDICTSILEKSYFLYSQSFFRFYNIKASIGYVLHHISKVKHGFQ